jgi:hypothetical protein
MTIPCIENKQIQTSVCWELLGDAVEFVVSAEGLSVCLIMDKAQAWGFWLSNPAGPKMAAGTVIGRLTELPEEVACW